MKTINSHRPLPALIILSLCLLFLGINGIIGGYMMLSDPNGSPFGMSLSVLERTPFQNWIVPGLVLLFVWGCGSFAILLSLWLRPQLSIFEWLARITHEHWSWILSIGLGLALLVWLTYQLFTLPAVAPIQYILGALAVLLVVVPLLPGMRQYYGIQERE